MATKKKAPAKKAPAASAKTPAPATKMTSKDKCCNTVLNRSLILRFAIGSILLIAGIAKFQMGTGTFVGYMTTGFESTFLPAMLVTTFAQVLPYVEVALGALLLLGLYTKTAAKLSALLFAILIFGLSSQQNPDNTLLIAAKFIYIFAAFKILCASTSVLSLDYLRCKDSQCDL